MEQFPNMKYLVTVQCCIKSIKNNYIKNAVVVSCRFVLYGFYKDVCAIKKYI